MCCFISSASSALLGLGNVFSAEVRQVFEMAFVEYPINSHLERLAYDEIRERPSLFGDVWMPTMFGTIGFALITGSNVAQRKPLYTGKLSRIILDSSLLLPSI